MCYNFLLQWSLEFVVFLVQLIAISNRELSNISFSGLLRKIRHGFHNDKGSEFILSLQVLPTYIHLIFSFLEICLEVINRRNLLKAHFTNLFSKSNPNK